MIIIELLSVNNMEINKQIYEKYDINVSNITPITNKSYKVICDKNNCYFIKNVPTIVENKYMFLINQGINNVLYPIINKDRKYLSNYEDKSFYINDFIDDTLKEEDLLAYNMFNSLNQLHLSTGLKRQLSSSSARPKIEEITKQLDYKFILIEQYIRSLETKQIDKSSFVVLEKYHIILNAKNVLVKLQKKIISSIKDKESVEYAFIHNNPKLDHLIIKNGNQFLTSIEKSKIGISSLDMAKFYIENSNYNIDYKKIIYDNYYKQMSDFYYDYFRFLVLFIYIKSIHFTKNEYVNKELFIDVSNKIDKFLATFSDESN